MGSLPEIDDQISYLQRILLSSHRSHPLRSLRLQVLANLYNDRCPLSGQKEDMDMSILYNTEAVLIASRSYRADQDTALAFYHLAISLRNRSMLGQPSNAQYCDEYFRYLESQPPEAFDASSDVVKVGLVLALASRAELGIGDAARNIQEMVAHCRHLLASNIPQPMLESAIQALVDSSTVYYKQSLAWEYQDQVVDCLREANSRHYSPEIADYLAILLSIRFQETGSIDNYEEAMALFDKIITSESESNRDSPVPIHVMRARFHSASLARGRAIMFETPESAEEAIYRHRAVLRTPPTDDFAQYRYGIAENLEVLMEDRASSFGVTEEGLPEALSLDAEVTSFPRLIASLHARSTTDKTKWWAVKEENIKYSSALKSVCRTTDIAEIGDAIEYCRLLLASSSPSHPAILQPAQALGRVLFHAFKCTDNIEYLNKSIATFYDILQMPIARFLSLFDIIEELVNALSVRLTLSGDQRDFDETMQLYSRASKDTCVIARKRLRLSYRWAENARRNGHHSTSTAYEAAVSLLQDTLLYAPTLETQHFHLISLRHVVEELPLDIASYHVGRGQLEDAIQVLEQGRALIWSEMHRLRASIDKIAVDSHLAREFTDANNELETLTTSLSSGISRKDNDKVEDGEGMGNFGRLVVRHRELLAKRTELGSQMQELPGLEGFMKTPSFDTLRSAAVRGPVVIVNHSKWRCDILIVLHHTHPSLITTPEDSYGRVIELRNRLVRTRNNNPLESRQYQRALRFVLKTLYELVGQPVINELRRLEIPEQSRIWWCPTSVFCSLPLHAMGPIPSDDGVPRYFSDLYITSYTPTLSALIGSRKPSKSSFEKPSVLLVANPDDSLQDAWPEIWSVQRLTTMTRVTTLLGKRAKTSVVLEGLQDHQFSHFICHGNLVPEKPFDASFALYGRDRLTLLDIVRLRLPTAEFAFLSACHTAELTEGSIADEGLHLTAAVQYCGFRSVVGTMWAMADQDGGDLANRFYNYMFSSDESGVPYHERSARALRDAVQSMRTENRLPLEQWVNFVHYGA